MNNSCTQVRDIMEANSKSGEAATKYFLFLFNFIYVTSGLVLMGFGLLALYYHAVAGYAYTSSLGLILLVAGLTFLGAVMACFAAIHPSRCMLSMFGLFLTGMILVEVISLICFAASGGTQLLDAALQQEFNEARSNRNLGARVAVDAIQQKHFCCGFTGRREWGSEVPPSCCISLNEYTDCYDRPCLAAVNLYTYKIAQYIAGAAAAFFFAQVFGVCLAFFFAKRASKENHVFSTTVYTVLK